MEGWTLSSNRKWRNPYAPIPSKKLNDKVTEVSLAVTPKKVVPATVDLRTSVSKMRNNIKGIGTTIRQMEETMDTLYGAMEIFENFGKRPAEKVEAAEKTGNKRKSPASESAQKAGESSESESSGGSTNTNPLANIDIGQLLGLLQSPLVQNLLSQTVANTGKQRKKEG
jgi:hypothetical protein